MFKCQGLHHIRDRYPGLFGKHAETVVQSMRQADMHGIAKCVTDCLGVHGSTDPAGGVQVSDQPWVAGRDMMFLSLTAESKRR